MIEIESIDMPDLGWPEGDTSDEYHTDVIAYYGLKITTEHGRCVIDFRNESNGYYGGDLSFKYAGQIPTAHQIARWEAEAQARKGQKGKESS